MCKTHLCKVHFSSSSKILQETTIFHNKHFGKFRLYFNINRNLSFFVVAIEFEGKIFNFGIIQNPFSRKDFPKLVQNFFYFAASSLLNIIDD
jgi:hypothetical protein